LTGGEPLYRGRAFRGNGEKRPRERPKDFNYWGKFRFLMGF